MKELLTPQASARPLHPWVTLHGLELGADSTLWHDGANAAADAIVVSAHSPEVLLIQRADGTWANAGGFIDPTDKSAAHAAAREAREEAGIVLDPSEALPVYEGIVHDTRASRHRWVTTTAYLWRATLKLHELTAGDDAHGLRLVPLSQVRTEPLYGSHKSLIEQAIAQYGTPEEKACYYGAVT